MKTILKRAKVFSVATTLSLGLSLASSQASAMVIATAVAAHHVGHVPHAAGHHGTHHHGACAAGAGVTMGVGFALLFFCWPVGVLLDGDRGQGINVEGQRNLYANLPFLKGTQEGVDIEHFISQRVNEVSKDFTGGDEDADKVLAQHSDFQITKNEDGSQHLAIALPARWVEDKLSDGEYTQQQIDQAVKYLSSF